MIYFVHEDGTVEFPKNQNDPKSEIVNDILDRNNK